MQTNFFSLINKLELSGILKLVIAKSQDGQMVISLLLDNGQCADKAKMLIPPMKLAADAEELDKCFFEMITNPLQKTSSLLESMQQYMKGLEAAKAKSTAHKDKESKVDKTLSAKQKKYNDLMEQSAKLEAAGKFKEAWTKLPDPMEYPEQAELIRTKRQSLSDLFSPDLFASFSETTTSTPVTHAQPPIEHESKAEQEEVLEDDLEYNEYSGLEGEEEPQFEF